MARVDSPVGRTARGEFPRRSLHGETTSASHENKHQTVLGPRMEARENGLLLPTALDLDGWIAIGEQLAARNSSSAWWLGDWLVYGKRKFPDGYQRAIAKTSLDYQTLRNYAWVCRRFPVTQRRAKLSFQHHAELASVPPYEQAEWFDKAEALGWSVQELRRRLRAESVGRRQPPDVKLTFKLELSAERRERWQRAAAAAGMPMDSWVVSVLDGVAMMNGNGADDQAGAS